MFGIPQAQALGVMLRSMGIPHAANDNIASFLRPGDLDAIEHDVRQAIDALLHALVIERDHNTEDTPARVARMLVHELYKGRYQPMPTLTDFPNVRALDELYTVGPITVRSTCSHHLVPVIGQAWVGVIPGERVIGLSKFSRLVDWVMSRPQIQEEAVMQIADEIENVIAPKGMGVILRANHMCMTARGVRDHDTSMVTSVMRGLLLDQHEARNEFLRLVQAQGFGS